jgi:hypothetical protein
MKFITLYCIIKGRALLNLLPSTMLDGAKGYWTSSVCKIWDVHGSENVYCNFMSYDIV